jgi:hypothetical protein
MLGYIDGAAKASHDAHLRGIPPPGAGPLNSKNREQFRLLEQSLAQHRDGNQ